MGLSLLQKQDLVNDGIRALIQENEQLRRRSADIERLAREVEQLSREAIYIKTTDANYDHNCTYECGEYINPVNGVRCVNSECIAVRLRKSLDQLREKLKEE